MPVLIAYRGLSFFVYFIGCSSKSVGVRFQKLLPVAEVDNITGTHAA
jgi:hypothetical protein